MTFPSLRYPIIQAPMAGGPSTPALAAAVSAEDGLGFLAAGYRTVDGLRDDIAAVRGLTEAAFGVNLFYLTERPVDEDAVARYARMVAPEASRRGVDLGQPRFDDDWLDAKLDAVLEDRPPVVSFTFGCPTPEMVGRLHERHIAVWVTVTEVEEASQAEAAGADALIVQGLEAGGHRGSFQDDDGRGELALLPLLALVGRVSKLPLVASGGIADGAGVGAALAAGARAVQIGTAFMRCPEAGTSQVHRDVLAEPRNTCLTRAFSGRRARGVENRFMREYEPAAPAAYPHVHHLTAPLRAAARAQSDPEAINLCAGQSHQLAEELPAGELVRRLAADAQLALQNAQSLIESP